MCKQSLHVMMEHANLFLAGDMNLYNFARILIIMNRKEQ